MDYKVEVYGNVDQNKSATLKKKLHLSYEE